MQPENQTGGQGGQPGRPARRYLALFAAGFFAIAGGLAALNALVDPPLDTRREKTTALYAEGAGCVAAGVILGSSRIGIAGNVEIAGRAYFNLAMEDLFPHEYAGYLGAYEEACGGAPARVVIALDFFAASTHRYAQSDFPPPSHYIDSARDPLWPVRKAFSLDVLVASFETLRRGRPDAFRRDEPVAVSNSWRLRAMWYYRDVYRRFSFNENLRATFDALRARFPETEWTILTTPVSEPVFDLMTEHGLLDQYARWLEVSVSAFDRVHHFGGLNALTRSPRYFRDENHLLPRFARELLNRALGEPAEPSFPPDAETVLTAASLPAYLERLAAASAR